MHKFLISIVFLFVFIGAKSQVGRTYQLPDAMKEKSYHPSMIIVKLKNPVSDISSGNTRSASGILSDLNRKISISSISEAFPKSTKHQKSSRSTATNRLSGIYKIALNENEDIIESINALLSLDEVLYAEPYFAHQPLAVPNDPNAHPVTGSQNFLSVIRAYDAWSIEKGDTNVVIGILDTGLQPDHPDLKNSIAYNYDDPINGLDDDNDGLIDNFVGWDYADNDNNPTADTDPHGTEMSGIAAATTDNFAGMAGVGYQSKFLPIKIFKSGSNFFFGGYEAIVLAADLGCDVINLSWGSPNSFSQFGQDAINYAVLDKDVAIVAAAGNDRKFDNFYPASFDNVLSVAATDNTDNRAFFSSYSYNVDITAPGVDIYATTNGSSYIFRSGTSEASAVTAGAMALVRARFPELTGQQVIEKIRVNTDGIYDVGSNRNFDGQLGLGRLNLLRALEVNNSPSLRISETHFDNGSGSYAFFGDTLTISAELLNLLSPTANAQISLTSKSPYVQILEAEWDLGRLNTFEKKSNNQTPFRVLLSNDLPPNEEIVFRISMIDGAYNDFQHFIITSSPERLDVDNGQVQLTVTSDGDLGHDESLLRQGNGYRYRGRKILDNLGLVMAADQTTVYDNAVTSFFLNRKENDFQTVENVKFHRNSIADIDARMIFEEVPASGASKMRIEQSTLAWNDTNYLILEYRVINQGNSALLDLHTSLLADWNINNRDFNVADWDSSLNLGYVHSFDNDTLYAGLALITDQAPIYSAINNKNFNGNLADVPSVLNDQTKYELSSQGIASTKAGDNNTGNDVSHLLGGTIDSLGVNQAEKVAIVVVTGPTLQSLRDAVNEARLNYTNYLMSPPVLEVFPTCENESTIIDPSSGDNFDFYDSPNLSNLIASGSSLSTPPVSNEIVYYAVNRDNAFQGDVRRVIARVKPLDIDFDISPSILLLDETGNTKVNLTDQSIDAVDWSWDFGNGFTGIVQNPIMNYPATGTYDITLEATSDIGCTEMITKSLQVANRSNLPDIANQIICKSDSISLSANNVNSLEIYADAELTNLLFSGQPFHSGVIDQDTAFYVISTDSVFRSNVRKVSISLSDLEAGFKNSIDTLDLSSATVLNFENDSQNDVFYYWMINGQLEGINQPISFDYAGLTTFETKLIAEDADGCLDTLATNIVIPESLRPDSQIVDICEGESASISVNDDEIYVFYSNESKQTIISKGSTFKLMDISTDTTIYYSNIGQLGESPLASTTFDVNDIQAAFALPDEVINSVNQSEFFPENNSVGATSWRWFIDDELVSIDENPSISSGSANNYLLVLEVQNDIGCQDTISIPYQVVTITGVDDFNIDLSVYPNPTTSSFQINHPGLIEYSIVNFNGTIVAQGGGMNPRVDLGDQPDGVYFLSIKYQGEISWRKIIKKD